MYRTMAKSVISNMRVTRSCLGGADSISIDRDLLDAADVHAGEVVSVRDVLTGSHVDTFVTAAERGSGTVAIGFVGAQRMEPGDRLVLTSYALVAHVSSAADFVPRVIQVNQDNRALDDVAPPAKIVPA